MPGVQPRPLKTSGVAEPFENAPHPKPAQFAVNAQTE